MEHSLRAWRRLRPSTEGGLEPGRQRVREQRHQLPSVATDSQLQADVQEEQDQLNDDLDLLKVIPVISIGFSIKS